ncbi:hypothetical protein TNCT_360461 [Trichonephila clavata]|uniref:Uncharacterized protein n=1 Tax=Trichonephila clavata TaxID=2740835 RepID=A0A8X6IRD2_TRICU|nr:hypothetical protein TNCT_360461 [Trichonephila clavata]
MMPATGHGWYQCMDQMMPGLGLVPVHGSNDAATVPVRIKDAGSTHSTSQDQMMPGRELVPVQGSKDAGGSGLIGRGKSEKNTRKILLPPSDQCPQRKLFVARRYPPS